MLIVLFLYRRFNT